MEIDSQRIRHEDQMSRSFGSNYQRCNQSRKMSVGIAAASSANMSSISGNRSNPKGKRGSPWVSPKPLAISKTVSDVFNTSKKVKNVESVGGTCSNLGVVAEPTAGTILQSGSSRQQNVDAVLPEKEGKKDVLNPERRKVFTQPAVEEVSARNEGSRGKETLKMKLWEVLRTAPPVDKKLNDSGSAEVDAQGNNEDVSFKPRVNSDTIETDSGNPEVAVSRPLTRSLSRKRGSAVASPKRLRKKLFPAKEEKNVFSFEEKCYYAQNAATGRHLQCKTNSTGKKNLNIGTIKTSDPPPLSNIQQASSGSKKPSNGEEISLRSGIGIARGNQDQGRMKKAIHRENSHSSLEATDSGLLKERNDQISPVKGGKEDHFDCGSEPRIANLINDIFGLVNNVKTDARLPILSAQAKETQEQIYTRMLARRIIFVKDAFRVKSNLTEKQMNVVSHCSTESPNDPADSDGTVQSMKEKYDAEVYNSERLKINKAEEVLSISNGSGDDMDITPGRANCSDFSPIMHSPYVSGEFKDTTPRADDFEKQMPCQRNEFEVPPRFNLSDLSPFHFPNELPAIEGSKDDSDSDADRTEQHISSPARDDAINFTDLSPTFCSLLATRLTDASQEYQGDEVERAIALFGCALEKFKNKLVSSTKKRSSEVLESTAEEIQSKFESAKSLIEKDVTKLTNASRSKRQTLEKSFNEHEEQLKLIHMKYKDEIRRHIHDYSRTVEGLETHGKDLREVIERRKALHQKLLVQVEVAVENHLSNAQRELISIHKDGKSKMLHLKTAISGCLRDGIFT